MCSCCGQKGHSVSDCLMKDKMLQENWATKKGMQMVQNLNDEATSKANKPDDKSEDNDTQQNNQKRVYWSGTQLQGCQVCTHVQSHQNTNQS